MNKALVVGASGATGKLLVAELLGRDFDVFAIVRSSSSLVGEFGGYSNYHEIQASILDMSDSQLKPILENCDVVCSCLGHNLTFKGIYAEPRRLVTNTIQSLCRIIEFLHPTRKVRVILMNTTGNSNRDIPEIAPLSQRVVISILRYLLPPHIDNEQAADFLRTQIGQNHQFIEWAAVRPDSLTNEKAISDYEVHQTPIRNAIFNSGATSRINVAHFMASLATDTKLWSDWKGRMPVIYNDTNQRE